MVILHYYEAGSLFMIIVLLLSTMDNFVDTGLCSYALVLVIFTYIVYNIISIEFDFDIIENNHGDMLLMVFHELDQVIIIDIED